MGVFRCPPAPTPFSTPYGDGCLEQQPTAGGLDTHAPPLPLPATAPTPGSIHHTTPPTTGPHYAPGPRKTGAKKGADWLERAQLTCAHCSPSPAALPAVLHQPRTSTRSLETKLRTDRVALATFVAGTYRERASAPPNNDNSTVPPHHRTTTHSLNKPTHTGCVGPAAKYCLLITSCGPPTATRRAPPRATRY